jgi:hypothetical protein
VTDNGWVREVPCKDPIDRDRHFKVRISERNEVVVVAPPGEVGRLAARDLAAFKQALTDAQWELMARGVEIQ